LIQYNIYCIVLHRKEGSQMRLTNILKAQKCIPSDVLVLIRHGIDDPVLTQQLNQPLIEQTKPDIRTLSKQVIELCRRIGTNSIILRHSNRLRAIETADIIAKELLTTNLSTKIIETEGVREIHQGDFIIRGHITGTEYKPLVNAWKAWQKKLDECELLYHFGDPHPDKFGIIEFPELVGWFNTFGENQADFSLRLYRTLREVFAESRNDDCLQVIVGHQASCSRMQRIISASSQLSSAGDFEPGHFVRFHEKKGSRVTIDPACGVALRKPDRDLMVSVLEREIKYLEGII
jgi:broad specificity phosphatase PhoE